MVGVSGMFAEVQFTDSGRLPQSSSLSVDVVSAPWKQLVLSPSIYCIFLSSSFLCTTSVAFLVVFSSFSVSLTLCPQACASQSILAWRLTGGMNTSQLAIHASPPLFLSHPSLLPSTSHFSKIPLSALISKFGSHAF